MKKLHFLVVLLIFVASLFVVVNVKAYVSVKGYYKSNGTYVAPHVRSDPNGLKYDNYSYKPSQGLYNDSYGTKGSTWDTPTYITDPDYYTGKSIYDSQNPNSYNAPSYTYTAPTTPTCPTNSYYNDLTSNCKCNSGYVVSGDSCVYANTYCSNLYGNNSEYDQLSKQCKCGYGSLWNDDTTKCVTYDTYCVSKYGSNSTYYDVNKGICKYCTGGRIINKTTDTCSCQDGYHWDQVNTTCVANPNCLDNQILDNNNKCKCVDGYVMKDNTCITFSQDCSNTYGLNVYGTKFNDTQSNCFCNSGYQWNSDKTFCVEVPNQEDLISITTREKTGFVFTKNLKFGTKNIEVTKLQQILKDKGYYKIGVTNYFGAFTRSALIKLQSDNGLKADGIVGPEMRGYLNNL